MATKRRLKLDDEQSWIITSEVNRFTWKGPDVRKAQAGEFSYGYLPHDLIKSDIEQFRKKRGLVIRVDTWKKKTKGIYFTCLTRTF